MLNLANRSRQLLFIAKQNPANTYIYWAQPLLRLMDTCRSATLHLFLYCCNMLLLLLLPYLPSILFYIPFEQIVRQIEQTFHSRQVASKQVVLYTGNTRTYKQAFFTQFNFMINLWFSRFLLYIYFFCAMWPTYCQMHKKQE